MIDLNTVVILVGIAVGVITVVAYIRYEVGSLRSEFKSDMDSMETRVNASLSDIRADIRVMVSRLRRVEAVMNFLRGIFVRNRGDLEAVLAEIDRAEDEVMEASESPGD